MSTRRQVLGGLATAALLPKAGWSAVGAPCLVSAAKGPDGRFVLTGLNERGEVTFSVPLPARGHAAAAHPSEAHAVAIARRPGTFALVIDCVSGRVLQTLEAPPGRHFFGHAVFSEDGRYVFTTENDYETGLGRIGVWDRSKAYQRIGEFASGGIGPHEIIRLLNGDLAIANGGIRTHPDQGRAKLNLDTMQANLTIMSPLGDIKDQAVVPHYMHHNSLRHIAAQQDGVIGCGFQWQGDLYETPSLFAVYRGNGRLSFADMPDQTLNGLKGYIGSVSQLGDHGFAATSPRGGQVLALRPEGRDINAMSATDICGVALTHSNQTMATDGLGHVYELSNERLTRINSHALAFDNHLVAIA